jgi:hypothetical protein
MVILSRGIFITQLCRRESVGSHLVRDVSVQINNNRQPSKLCQAEPCRPEAEDESRGCNLLLYSVNACLINVWEYVLYMYYAISPLSPF